MSDRRTNLPTQPEAHESLGELLRARALATSPRLLTGQAVAGIALNAAVLVWHPDRWGIATAAMVTVASHALWSLAVQRTGDATSVISEAGFQEEDAPDLRASDKLSVASESWWRTRRASAFAASASALVMFWFVCMMLLGRMIS